MGKWLGAMNIFNEQIAILICFCQHGWKILSFSPYVRSVLCRLSSRLGDYKSVQFVHGVVTWQAICCVFPSVSSIDARGKHVATAREKPLAPFWTMCVSLHVVFRPLTVIGTFPCAIRSREKRMTNHPGVKTMNL